MSGQEFFDRLFSSMCFGGVFGTWLLFTIIATIEDGWTFAVGSVIVYVAAMFAVAGAGWLAMLFEHRTTNRDRN